MADDAPDDLALDLTACDREPIHIPGLIQPLGFLLACSSETWRITHISCNALAMGNDPAALIGKHARDVIGRDVFHALTNALAGASAPSLPGRVIGVRLPDGRDYDVVAHVHRGVAIFEFEPTPPDVVQGTPLLLVRSMLMRIQGAETIDAICAVAVQQLRALIDFDRVMVYRFLPDGAGTVIAESRADGVPSFLGHHYPASDIPRQARDLYLKNWLRYIADVDAVSVAVAGHADAAPLDMSFCSLRSVSPIHIRYLKNMDVGASLSISIVVAGALWGLIACHNRRPRRLLADTRLAAEFFGQTFSLQLQTLARADVSEMLRAAKQSIDRIVVSLPPGDSLSESFAGKMPELRKLIPCDGVALWFEGRLTTTGACPPDGDIPRIAAALAGRGATSVFATHEISQIYDGAGAFAPQASGLMAVPLSRAPEHYLMLFRREFVHTIDWAGNPSKTLDSEDGLLTPRASFEIWREEVRGQSRVWEPHDCLTGEALRIALLEIVLKYNEVVAEERAKAERRQRIQTEEFRHRVKNALALIGALVAQSRVQHDDVGAFVSDLEGSIRALALAHDLASRPGALELAQLVSIELAPYASNEPGRITTAGPSVALRETSASAMALVVHELATNASKHGALSNAEGRLSVRWSLTDDGGCSLMWHESGGPPVRVPNVVGFGMQLIGRQVPFELGGRANIDFDPAGLKVEFWLPPDQVGAGDPSAGAMLGFPVEIDLEPLQGHSVLLVEDSLVVAMELEDKLKKLGAGAVYMAGTIERALAAVEEHGVDLALLDINLKGTKSFAVADVLVQRGIPFAFATGYGIEGQRPRRFKGIPVLSKPYDRQRLAGILVATLQPKSEA